MIASAGHVVVRASGELDIETASNLSARLNEAIRETPGAVVVDLQRVSFIDSTGLAVLLNAQRRMKRARRRLGLVVSEGPVARALAVTRLDWTFDVFPSVEAAAERIGASSGAPAPSAG